jgi:hypothetical protein
MVVGGYALAFHGKPRHTGDLDIWINSSETNAEKLVIAIKEFGLSSLGLTKSDFMQEGYVTQIGYPPLRIDILNTIDGVSYQGSKRGAAGTELGTGFSNTDKIIASQGRIATNYAAGLARAYNGGGYTDWYLPSKDELNKLFLNRVAIGNFISNDLYWSSSEIQSHPYHSAWLQDFGNGGPLSTFKDYVVNVRAIRSF